MPTLYPCAVLPNVDQQLCDANGQPVAGGKLYFYEANSSTPLAVYSDPDGDTAQTNPVILDADGRPPDAIFIAAESYKTIFTDADDATIWTRTVYQDPGSVFANHFGVLASDGARDETSGYVVQLTDRLITMDGSGGANPCIVQLPAASDATQMLTIKNVGSVALAVTPDGSDTIDTVAAAYTVPVEASPVFPTITIIPDGVSGWWIIGSHGL
jgi:hypothetical protein